MDSAVKPRKFGAWILACAGMTEFRQIKRILTTRCSKKEDSHGVKSVRKQAVGTKTNGHT